MMHCQKMSEECSVKEYSERRKGKGKILFDPRFFRIKKIARRKK